MINTIQTLIGPAAPAAERSPLVDQLARRADANHDGQVTSAELAGFFADLMQALDDDQSAQRAPAAAPHVTGRHVEALSMAASTIDPATMTQAQGAALLRRALGVTGTEKVR